MKALFEKDLPRLREISNCFYRVGGVYQRACDYFANFYRYDWYIVPKIFDDTGINTEKILSDFQKQLNYLENTHIKKICGDIALKVILNGVYYGYAIDEGGALSIQELPPDYCRSRHSVHGLPVVEFNMRFFDDEFVDPAYRMKILKMFPKEFQKGYILYKQGKLNQSEEVVANERPSIRWVNGWYLLEPENTVKFNLNNTDVPIFISALPAILDLDAAQDLDRRKQMQSLLKILIQKLPLDKNGDLIFDIDEAQDIHNNVVKMLSRAVGVDVVTTFADVDAVSLVDKNTTATQDDLAKVERSVYNALGLSKNIFNTDGNMALEKSNLEDESTLRQLILQFEIFYNRVVQKKTGQQKKIKFDFYMLGTTEYNYKDLSKMYKEHVQIGYSKMLPQIALGHSQSAIINTAYFENKVLNLSAIMIPPLMSSTLNGEDILGKTDSSNATKNQNNTNKTETVKTEEKSAGRPSLPDDQKSEKTIQNIEAMS